MDSIKRSQWKLQMWLRRVKGKRKEDWRRWILARIALKNNASNGDGHSD
jgi:hypothetical protein